MLAEGVVGGLQIDQDLNRRKTAVVDVIVYDPPHIPNQGKDKKKISTRALVSASVRPKSMVIRSLTYTRHSCVKRIEP